MDTNSKQFRPNLKELITFKLDEQRKIDLKSKQELMRIELEKEIEIANTKQDDKIDSRFKNLITTKIVGYPNLRLIHSTK